MQYLPSDDPEARLFAADIIGYLVGYANLTNTRSLALLGDPDASAYELLFSFSSPEEKNEFLSLVCSNENMGKDYIIELIPLATEEIRNARPLATVLPQDAQDDFGPVRLRAPRLRNAVARSTNPRLSLSMS
ncbi:MAG: hypothetical protein ABSD75_33640 [Terriglobales bacterium]|jgi:hypothetical protein